MNKIFLCLIPVSVFFFSCSQSIIYTVEKPGQSGTMNKNAGPSRHSVNQNEGKCYKNCLMPDRFETRRVSYPIYTGIEPDAPMRVETLLIEPAKTRLEKRNNGEMCQVEIPAQTRRINVLADTTFYRDFRYETFEYKVLVQKGGYLRETEVLCEEKRTSGLYQQINSALKAFGYLESANAQWSIATSQALEQFQIDHGLPTGDLNVETLKLLGI